MISKHCSYKEGIRSATACRLGIENIPNSAQLESMELVAEKVFEPLREFVGGPIVINSFFRCLKLNTAIGGSKTSQHMVGEAMDIDDTLGHKTNAEMFHFIKDNLSFHQLIWEFGDDENPRWLHVSYKNDKDNRKQVLKAITVNGRTKYVDWNE